VYVFGWIFVGVSEIYGTLLNVMGRKNTFDCVLEYRTIIRFDIRQVIGDGREVWEEGADGRSVKAKQNQKECEL
jgi:hypothetical protein